jgi:hypothetical protein
MRWGVEYEQNDGGMIGLILFSADDLQGANDYVDDMCKKFGFTRVSNLKQITGGASVPELRLAPDLLTHVALFDKMHS